MIIGIVNQKGGVGKTTLAVNLAGAQVRGGSSVCIIDTDPQGSVLQWQAIDPASRIAVRHMPAQFNRKTILPLRRKHDHLLIDSPPALEQITVEILRLVDAVIIPVTPSPLDIWSANETIKLIKSMQRRNRKLAPNLLVYRRIPGTQMGSQARDALKNYGLPVFKTQIAQRIAYVEAMNTGLSVVDYAPHSKAAGEIRALAEEIF
jgi:chromosome partitioning protein